MTFLRHLVLFASIIIYPNLLWGEDKPKQHLATEAIPPLPEETAVPAASLEIKPEEPLVVNVDQSKTDFFSDTSFNTGFSRSLNALDLAGYLRLRMNYFRNGHLGTYIPGREFGTSLMPPSLEMIGKKTPSQNEDNESETQNPGQNNFSANMRLRINPTLNVSEVVRVKGAVDIFDNMVLGSTPNYLSQGAPSPSWPSSLMSMSQNPPIRGVNSWQGAINVKRAYGEVSFPFGELRFGRMPISWGLGILYNSGDDINNDYGDQIDGISMSTRVFDHFIIPSYSIAYTGPVARGGGLLPTTSDFPSAYLPAEAGQRYPLESGDITHVFTLSFLKRESDFIVDKKRQEGRPVYNYGLLSSYRRQFLDSQAYSQTANFVDLAKNVVKRESHVGIMSLWQGFSLGTFHVEAEAAGIWGKYQIGEKDTDLLARNDNGQVMPKRPIWLLSGGIALESKYGFLSDRLQVGLNSGIASSQQGPGFGIREGSKKNPVSGDADGRKMPAESDYKTNFKFNPAYTVDLLLYREVLGGIVGSFYLKPHISYFFSRNFGLRGDVLTALALDKSNTTGNSNWLGVELDTSSFFRTENGFYFQLSYGVLFPLKGLNHRQGTINTQEFNIFGEAKTAQTVQAFLGVTF